MATNISTEAQLQACHSDLSLDYTITNDITCTGDFALHMIGAAYNHTFDGGNYTLINFQYAQTATSQGLFRGLAGGTIKNVKMSNIAITAVTAQQYQGAICGYMTSGTIDNCHVLSGTWSKGSYYIGGIVGIAEAGTVTNCTNAATVVQTVGHCCGGIIGLIQTAAITLSDCSNSGAISTTQATNSYVGGIVGRIYIQTQTITRCSNTGSVTGSGVDTGGIVGVSSAANVVTLIDCFNTGAISGTSRVGGLVGEGNIALNYVTGPCYNEGTVTGTVQLIGGLIGYKTAGTTTLDRAYNIGNITTGTTGTSVGYIGGLVGDDAGTSTYSGCYNTGIILGFNLCGGLIGYTDTSSSITLTNCYNTGEIKQYLGITGAGGLIGATRDNATALTITGCHNSGDVTLQVDDAGNVAIYWGGIIGNSQVPSTYSNSYNTGNIGSGANMPYDAGGFIGQQKTGTSTFTNCWSSGTVSGDRATGGFAGLTLTCTTTFTNCWATGNMSGGSVDFLGGFIGAASYTSGTATFNDCYATGNVACARYYAGGFVGGSITTTNVFNRCFATGEVTATAANLYYYGGFCGLGYGTFTDCWASGDAGITGTDLLTVAGGFIGISYNTINRCYSVGSAKAIRTTGAGPYCGGFVGYQASGTVKDCFSIGAVSGTGTTYSIGNFCGGKSGTITNCGCMITGSYRDVGSVAADVTYHGTDPYVYIGNTSHGVFTRFADVWDFKTTPIWYMYLRDFPKLERKRTVY